MMEELFLTALEISVSVGIMMLLLFLFSPLYGRRYGAGWSYLLLTALAVRLVILYNWTFVNPVLAIKIPLFTSGTDLPMTESGSLSQLPAGDSVWRISAFSVIFAIWLLGAALVLGLHLFSYLHYRRKLINGAAQLLDEKVLQQLESLQEELRVHRRISLLRSSEIASPMAMGFRHSLLVFPDREYTEEEWYFILRHERVHLKRGDLYVRLLFVAAEAVHWFNPLVWLLQRQAAVIMEQACDEQVVKGMDYQERKNYTKALLSAMSGRNRTKIALSTYFSGGTEIMKKRFQNILEKKDKKNGLPFLCLSGVAVLALGALVACQAEEPEEYTQEKYIQEGYTQEKSQYEESNIYLPNEVTDHINNATDYIPDESAANTEAGLLETDETFETWPESEETNTGHSGTGIHNAGGLTSEKEALKEELQRKIEALQEAVLTLNEQKEEEKIALQEAIEALRKAIWSLNEQKEEDAVQVAIKDQREVIQVLLSVPRQKVQIIVQD